MEPIYGLTTSPLMEPGGSAPRGMRNSGGYRILAVEDSASARKLLQEILLRLGVSLQDLRLASNPQEAQQVFTDWRPNLVLLDMDLGRAVNPSAKPADAETGDPVDGHELGKRFLKRNPGLKLVIVTALDLDSAPVKALQQQGAVAVITKPVLAARVQEVLSSIVPSMAPGASSRGNPPPI